MGKRSRIKKERWREKIGKDDSDRVLVREHALVSQQLRFSDFNHVDKVPQTLKSPKEVLNFFKLNAPILLLITILAIISYANGLNGQFLSADDIPGIVQNPKLRDFPQVAKSLNLTSTYASAVVNIFGLSSFAFHLGNLILHILNTFLVILLAYQLFGKRVALYASLVFCLLPSGSEAVFWIASMSYVFQALFSLICINIFFLFRTTGYARFFIASALIYILSLLLLQTPWMFTVPFIIVALDLFTRDSFALRTLVKRWWQYGFYFLAIGIYWLVFMSRQFSARVSALVTDYYFDPGNPTSPIFRLPYTVYKTVELYLIPMRLSFFHEETLTKHVYYFMVAVTIIVFGLLVWLVYKKSTYGGLLLAIFASIAPTFSPVQVAWFIAERYLYLGGAFFAMLLAIFLIALEEKATGIKTSKKYYGKAGGKFLGRFGGKNLLSYLVFILLVLYSVRLITRANDFKSSKTLWTATQKTAPTSYRVYNNLGDVYSNEQDWPKAIANFKKSIDLAPDYADAIHNLGYTYMLMGDYENAKKYLLESYQKNSRLYQALEKLGQIELKQGNTEQAKEYFEKVRDINPSIQGIPIL